MSDFNYIEYLKNNPLFKGTKTRSTKLITEAQEDTIDRMYAMKKAKMKVSELKAKIREEILSTLNEEEDYEKMGREVEYGVFPGSEDELSPEEMMGDTEDIRAILDKERFKPMKFDDPKLDQEYQEWLATNDYDGPLEERKDEEEAPAEEEEMDTEVNVDVEASPGQGLSAEEQEIQNSLKIAYDSAAAIGDQKLADQIGNSITFFTRTHVVER